MTAPKITPDGVRGFADAITVLTAMRIQMQAIARDWPDVLEPDDTIKVVFDEMGRDPTRLMLCATGMAALLANTLDESTLDDMLKQWVKHWLYATGLVE